MAVISRFFPAKVKRLLGMRVKAPMPTYQLLDQPGQLEPLLKALDRVDEVFLDTEADNMNRYRTAVCLLQFLVDGEVYLVDALAPMKFDALWQKLSTKHLVMHGSDYDLRLLYDLCEFRPKSIFDTMLAEFGCPRRRSTGSPPSCAARIRRGPISRRNARGSSPPRSACRGCIGTISCNSRPAWRSTTPFICGAATLRRRRTTGRAGADGHPTALDDDAQLPRGAPGLDADRPTVLRRAGGADRADA